MYGDPARLRDSVRRLIKRGHEILAQIEAAEDRCQEIARASTSEPGSLAYYLEFLLEQYDQSQSITSWSRAIHRQLSNGLGPAADKQLPSRSWPNRVEREPTELLRQQRRFVENRISDLEKVLSRLPSAVPINSPQSAEFAELRASGLVEEVQLNAYLRRMSSYRTRPQISASIGAAKELVEAVLIGALAVLDANQSPEHDLLKLAKQVRRRLEAEFVAAKIDIPGEATTQLLAGFASIESALAALRNQVGLGHGRTKLPESLRATHALLAIDVAHTYTRYVIRSLADLRLVRLLDT